MTAKERVSDILQALPEDSSFDEILRDLAFALMVERGLADSDARRVVCDEELQHRIRA